MTTTTTQDPTINFDEAGDCLASLYDAVTKLTSSAARGKHFSKADRMEISGLVTIARFLAEAARVDLDGAYDKSVEGDDVNPRRVSRALICLNERLVKCLSHVMAARHKVTPEARQLLLGEAFDRFAVRELYALTMVLATAAGVEVAPTVGERVRVIRDAARADGLEGDWYVVELGEDEYGLAKTRGALSPERWFSKQRVVL